MKFIKKNKFTIIAIVCFLVIMLLVVQVKNIFFPNGGNALYGNRLDGIDEVKVSSGQSKKISNKLTENESVKAVKTLVNGKIINVIITVADEMSLEDAKGIAPLVLEELDDDQKKFFDVEVIIDKEGESTQFPIIGYKHHSKEGFTFTKDREEAPQEETEAES